jgi:hypothetical protein
VLFIQIIFLFSRLWAALSPHLSGKGAVFIALIAISRLWFIKIAVGEFSWGLRRSASPRLSPWRSGPDQ